METSSTKLVQHVVELLQHVGTRSGSLEFTDIAREYLRVPDGTDDVALRPGLENVEAFVHGRWLKCDILGVDKGASGDDVYHVKTRGAEVVFIDNVPKTVGVSKYVECIKTAVNVGYVVQDRFHVMHNATKYFNNQDSRYHRVAVLDLRRAAFQFRAKQEAMVDNALAHGLVQKTKTWQGTTHLIRQGKMHTPGEIAAMKESGLYHAIFTADEGVVPEDLKSPEQLKYDINRWATDIVAKHISVKDPVRGGFLVTKSELDRLMQSLPSRFEACRLPDGFDGYIPTGKAFCGMPKYSCILGTNCNENKHGLAPEYVVGDHVTREMATALFCNGFAASNADARRARGFEVRFLCRGGLKHHNSYYILYAKTARRRIMSTTMASGC